MALERLDQELGVPMRLAFGEQHPDRLAHLGGEPGAERIVETVARLNGREIEQYGLPVDSLFFQGAPPGLRAARGSMSSAAHALPDARSLEGARTSHLSQVSPKPSTLRPARLVPRFARRYASSDR